ncbi:MAG: RNA-guided pseudouridylation complex pseudouridine synthase subunit Cbf5 [Nanoarchaeota archaeon]
MSYLPFEKIQRKVLVKQESETSLKYGSNPFERKAEDLLELGVVNIDKPSGPTSHEVSAYVQKILGIKKSGHSGTLDPKVTGVLPIAMGRATRIVEMLLNSGKEYTAIMHLHSDVEEKKIREVCNSFVGKIKQLPPIKSSIKRRERYRKIYYLEILEIDGKDVLFKVGTQAGTYIRKLIHDIGKELGVGAHMAELRRTKAGPFREDTLITLQDLADAFYYWKKDNNKEHLKKVIQPVENAVEHLPKIWVIDTAVDSICHGAGLKIPGISKVESDIQVGEKVAIMSLKDELVAIGDTRMISKEMIKNERGISIKPTKVFMLPGTYPKIER